MALRETLRVVGSPGDGRPAGKGYLVPQEAAGALVTKTADGHTYFSVNGRSGASFQAHEGYFEFDATVRVLGLGLVDADGQVRRRAERARL